MRAWVNGEFVDSEKATVPILSHSFSRGTAVFEVVDVVSTHAGPAFWGLDQHVDRFFNSARYMYMQLPWSKHDIIRACVDTAKENEIVSGLVKFFAYYAETSFDVLPYDKKMDLAVFGLNFGDPKPNQVMTADPVSVCISSYRKTHPECVPVHAKATGNYVGGYLAKMEAREAGYQDVILLDTMGFVAEAATANFFMVKDHIIKTPTLRSVLPGVNRKALIEILRDGGYVVQETDIHPDELFECDEAFFTASVVKLIPIREIEDIPIGNASPGAVTRAAMNRVCEIYRGKNMKYAHWMTHIR